MSRRTTSRRPRYPTLLALASVGVALASCGPDPTSPAPVESTQALAQQQPDAGPRSTDFIGGDVAYETFPDDDAGVR